jgi:hypothetical protein
LTNKIPIIKVKSEIKKVVYSNPLIRDTVCIIGGFETTENYLEPTTVNTIQGARNIYGTDTSVDGNAALEQILGDNTVSNVIVVNVSRTSSDNVVTTVTQAELEKAITALDLIDFDILYVAAELTDALLKPVTDFAEVRFENKVPFGYVSAFTRATNSAYQTTAGKLGDWCYASVIQRLEVDNDELSLLESGAFIVKKIATMSIGDSLTARTIPEITGINSEDVETFTEGDDGAILTGYGYLLFRLINATTNTYEAVNSANPNGVDIYISRVRDAIVNDFALRTYLGKQSNNLTLDLIKMECNRIATMFKELGLIENMSYVVEKKDSETVNVIINSIEFAGIITEIDVFITIEVI